MLGKLAPSLSVRLFNLLGRKKDSLFSLLSRPDSKHTFVSAVGGVLVRDAPWFLAYVRRSVSCCWSPLSVAPDASRLNLLDAIDAAVVPCLISPAARRA